MVPHTNIPTVFLSISHGRMCLVSTNQLESICYKPVELEGLGKGL
jgi:hypothetical protein